MLDRSWWITQMPVTAPSLRPYTDSWIIGIGIARPQRDTCFYTKRVTFPTHSFLNQDNLVLCNFRQDVLAEHPSDVLHTQAAVFCRQIFPEAVGDDLNLFGVIMIKIGTYVKDSMLWFLLDQLIKGSPSCSGCLWCLPLPSGLPCLRPHQIRLPSPEPSPPLLRISPPPARLWLRISFRFELRFERINDFDQKSSKMFSKWFGFHFSHAIAMYLIATQYMMSSSSCSPRLLAGLCNWDALLGWTKMAMLLRLYMVNMFVIVVMKKSYLLAPMIPAVGRLSQITTPWSSKERASGISARASPIQDESAGSTVESASADFPENIWRLLSKYCPTTCQALVWHSSGKTLSPPSIVSKANYVKLPTSMLMLYMYIMSAKLVHHIPLHVWNNCI